MSDITGSGIIRRTRFLVVDGDKAALSSVEELLRTAGAPHVYLASAPLLALRTLQDPHARVDCIICAHKKGTITGLQFLQSLRSGRWGGGKIRDVKFILTMKFLDVTAVQVADSANVSGYYIGELDREAFIAEIVSALTNSRAASPLPRMQVAHVNLSGVDFIFVPFDAAFAQAELGYQQGVVNELQSLMQAQLLAGAVTPVWETADHGVGYFSSPQYHATLAALTLEFIRTNLNREMSVLRPPQHVALVSTGSAAYAELLAAEFAGAVADGPGAGTAPDGVFGGSPPSPAVRETAETSRPRVALSRGVHGGSPQVPRQSDAPDFGGPTVSNSNRGTKR